MMGPGDGRKSSRIRRSSEEMVCCDDCDSFRSKLNLVQHFNSGNGVHHVQLQVQCDICCKKLSTKENLKHHLRSAHNVNVLLSQLQECDICQRYATARRTHLRLHIQSHQGFRSDQWQQCDHCQLNFSAKYTLQRHLSGTHVEYKQMWKWRCDDCPSNLISTRANLARHFYQFHLAKSALASRFICDSCDKDTIDKNYVVKHFHIIHSTSPWRWKCDECSTAEFTSNRNLIFHMKAMHGLIDIIRGMQCDQCLIVVAQRAKMSRHWDGTRVHRSGVVREMFAIQCDRCSWSGLSKRSFLLHASNEHLDANARGLMRRLHMHRLG